MYAMCIRGGGINYLSFFIENEKHYNPMWTIIKIFDKIKETRER